MSGSRFMSRTAHDSSAARLIITGQDSEIVMEAASAVRTRCRTQPEDGIHLLAAICYVQPGREIKPRVASFLRRDALAQSARRQQRIVTGVRGTSVPASRF